MVLPALAEFADDTGERSARPFARLYKQLSESGIKVFVTPGVVEEIVGHLNRCIAFTSNGDPL